MSSRTARAAVWTGGIGEAPPRRPLRFLAPAFIGLFSLLAADPGLAQNFSVDDVSTNEGAAPGTTIFTFTVSRDATAGAASVDVETQDVVPGATAPSDYTAVPLFTLNFPDTVGSMPVQVFVNGDATVELTETFNVLLSNPSVGFGIADGTGVGTITNDDAATFGRLAGFNLPEGNAGTTPATFTVTLSAPVDVDVTVDIATEDLVATAADGDYVSATGTLTFLAGSTVSQTFDVPVNGDVKVEFDQRFQTRISNVQAQGRNVTILDQVQTARIQNDDLGRIAINDVTLGEGTGPGTTAFTFNVVLMDAVEVPAGQTLSVDVTTANGTATIADSDYVAAGPSTRGFVGTLGEIQTFVVQVNHDAKVELDETFVANLSNLVLPPPQLGLPLNVIIFDPQATGTITNDDAATLAIGDRIALETNTGSTPTFSFTATLSAQVDVPVNVDFATANGTATTGDSDYASASGTLNFAGTAGETKTVLVTVNGDDKVELDEVFFVNLSNIQAGAPARNVTFADNQGLGTIVNDETATLSINDVTLVEGASGTTPFNFTVTLSHALANPISVDVDSVDDTATIADSDFAAATPATLNFAGNQNESVPVTVNVNGDSNAELNEVFHVVMSNLQASGLTVNITDQGQGTINNDDVMDLAITKDDGGTISFPTGPIAYVLSYQNLGAKTARGVVITETVPIDTTFDAAGSDPGWVCTPDNSAGSVCTLDVGTVAAAGSGSATFALTVDDAVALPPLPTNITNTATISDETAGFADTSASNNSATDTTLVVESAPTSFFPLSPCRVIDTRNMATGGPALNANADRPFQIAPHAACGIPATAKAISVAFAAVNPTSNGNLRIHPGGTSVPLISSINYVAGQTRSNNGVVALSDTGVLAVFASQGSGTVDFILDVTGYFE